MEGVKIQVEDLLEGLKKKSVVGGSSHFFRHLFPLITGDHIK